MALGDNGSGNIACGSFTESGSEQTIELGWEPQYLLVKSSSLASQWVIIDVMRSFDMTNNKPLFANLSNAEGDYGTSYFRPNPTGITFSGNFFGVGQTNIYMAIRRPMKTPLSSDEVFAVDQR
jgi:hypothetical protein